MTVEDLRQLDPDKVALAEQMLREAGIFSGPEFDAAIIDLFFSDCDPSFIEAVVEAIEPFGDLTAIWTGNGDGVSYSDPENWHINTVPRNTNDARFTVIIPTGFSNPTNDFSGDAFDISRFDLDNDGRLRLSSDSSLTVLEEADIAGIISAEGGDFFATSDAEFVGDRVRLSAVDGSQVVIDTPSYSSQGLWRSFDADPSRFGDQGGTTIWELITVTGTDTLLDLSGLTEIDAGFDSEGNDSDHQQITVLDGGTLDLSSVVTVTAPDDGIDRIEFNLSGVAALIDLASLQTLTSAGSGDTRIELDEGATLDLPALETTNRVDWVLGTGSIVNAGILSDIDDSTFNLSDGANFNGSNLPGSYASQGLWRSFDADPSRFGDQGGTTIWELITVTGTDTLLDLSGLTEIDAGFDSEGNDSDHQQITVLDGGTLDLSSVVTVTAPDDGIDRIEFNLSGVAALIDLASLQTLTSAGSGDTRIELDEGATLDLPALETTNRVDWVLGTGSIVNAGILSDIDDSTFNLSDGANFNGSNLPGSYATNS